MVEKLLLFLGFMVLRFNWDDIPSYCPFLESMDGNSSVRFEVYLYFLSMKRSDMCCKSAGFVTHVLQICWCFH